jgi:hypothetical protein
MPKINGRQASSTIAARIPFQSHGALSAVAVERDRSIPSFGYLPAEYAAQLETEAPTYVVYSYSTPIAWWSESHGWNRPAVKYSMTTSHHQGRCPMSDARVTA